MSVELKQITSEPPGFSRGEVQGSIVQARNIIEMMQQDIAKLANQLANEREECAQIVDFMADNAEGGELRILSLRAAEAIRKRGQELHYGILQR
jgi:hypothetical protein